MSDGRDAGIKKPDAIIDFDPDAFSLTPEKSPFHEELHAEKNKPAAAVPDLDMFREAILTSLTVAATGQMPGPKVERAEKKDAQPLNEEDKFLIRPSLWTRIGLALASRVLAPEEGLEAEQQPVDEKAEQQAAKQGDVKAEQQAAKPADVKAEQPPAKAAEVEAKPANVPPQARREFDGVTWANLEQFAADPSNFEKFKGAHEEMIRRADVALSPAEYKKSLDAIPMLLKALKEDRSIVTGGDGKPTLSDRPLTTAERLEMHDAIHHDLNIVVQQTMTRLNYSQRLYGTKQFEDAEKYGKEAITYADMLPKDLIEQAGKQLVDDLPKIADPDVRKEMQKRAIAYSPSSPEPSMFRLPLSARKSLAAMYLGIELSMERGDLDARLGQNRAFKPDKAYDLSKETREKTKELLGFDPLDEKQARQDPSLATLFGGVNEVVANPEKYNLYRLVEQNKLAEMEKELKAASGFESMLVDIGVVTLVAGTLCFSRSPKTHAMVERMLGHTANAEVIAPVLSKAAGLGAAVLGAPLARHYGFKHLSGVEESWTDTGVHVMGSLAAAELGGRLLGKGSMFTGSQGRGIRALEGFDSVASSEWLALQGYETTGKVADLLIANGHTREANIMLKLPRGTALASDAGLLALDAAELTQSRMSSVGRAVAKDQKLASGVDHTKLAKALEEGGSKSIKDMNGLWKQMREDIQLLEQLDAETLRRSTPISEALGNKAFGPEGAKLQERLAELGVENVGQAKDLLSSLNKGLQEQFPKLYELQKANLLTPTTTLAEVASMTTHAFDGPGCARIMKLLPESQRAGVLTDRALQALSMGENAPTKIQQALAERYNPNSFHTAPSYYSSVPSGKSLQNTVWGTSLKGAAGTVLTYNSIVKTWDLMQQTNPQTKQNYTFSEALTEAHLPDVAEANAPAWLDIASSVMYGSPGQILLASVLIRPGAIGKPVWADSSMSTTRKIWNSGPLSHQAWNNWSAGVFSKPGMASAGALSGSLVKPGLAALTEGVEDKTRLKRMLENVQKPIENEPPPNMNK